MWISLHFLCESGLLLPVFSMAQPDSSEQENRLSSQHIAASHKRRQNIIHKDQWRSFNPSGLLSFPNTASRDLPWRRMKADLSALGGFTFRWPGSVKGSPFSARPLAAQMQRLPRLVRP
jgi:hypothetical protein